MRTLIVEDDLTSGLVLQKLLEPYGHSELVTNGIVALERFMQAFESKATYDLICLDILMPRLDGQSVLRKIRAIEGNAGLAQGHGIKIIMTSSLADRHNVMTAFRELCDGYLIKPIDRSRLVQLLAELALV